MPYRLRCELNAMLQMLPGNALWVTHFTPPPTESDWGQGNDLVFRNLRSEIDVFHKETS